MAANETGKQRAAKIPLDYYKRPNALERWKTWLALAALLLSAGWLAAGLFQNAEGQARYSRGPVANVHAIWEDNCNACHVPFTPIASNNWSSSFVDDPHASNQRCAACHAGPPHHNSIKEQGFSEPDCAACHLEHRGRDASLVRLPDSTCTQCHRNLANHGAVTVTEKPNADPYKNEIFRFAKDDHPEFRSIKSDPGYLLFNHKRHMTPGMVIADGGMPFRLQDMPDKADRDRYRKSNEDDNSTVKLECASCHQLESRDFPPNGDAVRGLPTALLNTARGSGAYMLPITYENQCRACHPLAFDGKSIRHRLQPKEVYQTFMEFYAGEVMKNSELFSKPIPVRPLPGKLLSDESGALEELVKLEDSVKRKASKAEAYFFQGDSACKRCHEVVNSDIKPTQVPSVWFKHALFKHAAHRAVDCQVCHPGASESISNKDVLVPGMNNCLECHAPQSTVGGKLRGGARYTCTECHRYHGGDAPLHGFGARPHAPSPPRDIDTFLLDRKLP